MSTTAIEWTEKTWNPVTGCSKVSPGCAHCYAEGVALRFWGTQYPPVVIPLAERDADNECPVADPDCQSNDDECHDGCEAPTRTRQFTDVMTHTDRLDAPLRWRKPAKVFVNSMSDLFHEDVPDAFIDRVFAVMALAPQHTFQVLTKRAERMRAYFANDGHRRGEWAGALHRDLIGPGGETHDGVERWCREHGIARAERERRLDIVNNGGGWHFFSKCWPLPNVWLGVSVENQHFADERIPLLLQTPAAVRFISAEPLLGRVDLRAYLGVIDLSTTCCGSATKAVIRTKAFIRTSSDYDAQLRRHDGGFATEMPRLNWVIVGGESGAGARPFDVAWARSIVQQCAAAGVPVFVKQLGAQVEGAADVRSDGWPAGTSVATHSRRVMLHDRKGGDPAEWPEDLRVREFPEARA